MEKKPKAPKGYHYRRGTLAKNPKPYKSLGERLDDKLKESLKKSGLW